MSESLLVATAEALARWLHRNQEDKQGRPYVKHLERVAARVAADGGTEEQIATGWLHDCIEDGHVGSGDLRAIFPDWYSESVPRLVCCLSRIKDGETYAEYIDRLVAQCTATLIVKRADLLDNLDPERGDFSGRELLLARYRKALARIEAAMESNP